MNLFETQRMYNRILNANLDIMKLPLLPRPLPRPLPRHFSFKKQKKILIRFQASRRMKRVRRPFMRSYKA